MTEQDQVRAIAELDGFQVEQLAGNTLKLHTPAGGSVIGRSDLLEAMFQQASVPDYIHSYDAIIPVIQKLELWQDVSIEAERIFGISFSLRLTPSQLCQALLKAAGRWTE